MLYFENSLLNSLYYDDNHERAVYFILIARVEPQYYA